MIKRWANNGSVLPKLVWGENLKYATHGKFDDDFIAFLTLKATLSCEAFKNNKAVVPLKAPEMVWQLIWPCPIWRKGILRKILHTKARARLLYTRSPKLVRASCTHGAVNAYLRWTAIYLLSLYVSKDAPSHAANEAP